MHVVTIYQKGSGKVNEDQLVVQDNLFAVIDGAGSLVPWRSAKNETGGQLAARIVKKTFMHERGSLVNMLTRANKEIAAQMKRMHVDTSKNENRWAAAFAAVVIHGQRAKFVSVADSLVLLIMSNGSPKQLITNFDHDRETLLKWKKLARRRALDIREKLLPQLIKVRRLANKRYGSLNGESGVSRFVRKGTISLKGVRSILLFTDGLIFPKKDPRIPDDWDLFSKIYLQSGLKGLLRHVRDVEKRDPNCWKYPRLKQRDDVAAICIDL